MYFHRVNLQAVCNCDIHSVFINCSPLNRMDEQISGERHREDLLPHSDFASPWDPTVGLFIGP